MELAFGSKHLRERCLDQSKAVRAYGMEVAETLRARLADLRAVTFLEDLPVSPTADLEDPLVLSFPLSRGATLLTRVSHERPPLRADGSLDTSAVRRLLIEEVRT